MQEIIGDYFITIRNDHDPLLYVSEKIKVLRDCSLLESFLSTQKAVGFDIEANGSRIYCTTPLLISIGNWDTHFVIDLTRPELVAELIKVLNKFPNLIYIGHNIKYDILHTKPNGFFSESIFGIIKIVDTFILEQRINLGITGIPAALEDVYRRRLNTVMDTDKKIRLDFLFMTVNSTFLYKHIWYSGGDIKGLIRIAQAQREILRKQGSYNWVNEVEMGLTPILADMELEGFLINEPVWVEIVNKKKKDILQAERFMDNELMKSGKFKFKTRNTVEVVQTSLFGEATEKTNLNPIHLNYGSSPQVLKAIRKMGYEGPYFKEKGQQPKPSTRTEALQQYLIENPGIEIQDFLEKLIEHKELKKFVSSYGSKFLKTEVNKKGGVKELGYKNPVTGLVHTVYKQCETETGRLASGRAKEGYYNSQQIPAEKEVRQAFTLSEKEIREGWYISTVDLSGAELTIMSALANDIEMYRKGADKFIDGKKIEGDLHSPTVTACWRGVYKHRYERFIKNYGLESYRSASIEQLNKYFSIKDSKNAVYILTADFLVNKEVNKQLRKDGKNNTFGAIYGMRDTKCAQTLNIPKDDAGAVLAVIRNLYPKVFKMVEDAAMCAVADGYVIFNNTSFNRRSFDPVLSIVNGRTEERGFLYNLVKEELPFFIISEIESAARNARIQGTQADMIKHATVNIIKHAIKHNVRQDVKPLLMVHDELVIKHKGTEFKDTITEIMKDTCNIYLEKYSSEIKMGAEAHIGYTWTK